MIMIVIELFIKIVFLGEKQATCDNGYIEIVWICKWFAIREQKYND